MPGQNSPPLTYALLTLGGLVSAATSTAAGTLSAWETASPPIPSGDACSDLEALKQRLNDMIAAVNQTMADLNCGA